MSQSWQQQRFQEALACAVLAGEQSLILLLDDLHGNPLFVVERVHAYEQLQTSALIDKSVESRTKEEPAFSTAALAAVENATSTTVRCLLDSSISSAEPEAERLFWEAIPGHRAGWQAIIG